MVLFPCIVFSREEEKQFLLCHIPLIEIEIIKLEAQILKATLSRTLRSFDYLQAWLEFVHNVCLLYNSYRFRSPVWLSLMNEREYASTANNFCTNLAALICEYDLKSTRYFLSTLLSCVLMNHLAWVASVTPSEDCEDLHRSLLMGTSGSSDCMRYPYNAQLAQYMEISGSVGGATRLARTVIIGNDMKLITHLLYVLTYFVRCSAIQPNGSKGISKSSPKEPEFVVLRETAEPGVNAKRSGWCFPLTCDTDDSTNSSLAWSMLAGPCDSYCSHFVICGLRLAAIDLEEVCLCRFQLSCVHFIMISGDDTNVGESLMTAPCDAVVTMLEQFGDLYRLGAAPTFLLSFIEDCLSHILTRSLSLVELLGGTTGNKVTAERVVSVIGCDYSDLRLIVNVAAVYYPSVLQAII
uniref:Bm5538, isoform b n=1 Tax=Brugia malayi TaxID=6279 RepID=A0A1I9G518_BRUMA|nr:Bm5538, isoform b [Brugia malayi]